MDVLFVVNNPSFFISHRLPLSDAIQNNGGKVHLCAPKSNRLEFELLSQKKIALITMPLTRTKISFWSLLQCFFLAVRLVFKRKTIFHLVSIIPIVIFGLPARIFNKNCVFAISGMGSVFTSTHLLYVLVRPFIIIVYYYLFNGKNSRLIVQNYDDFNFFKIKLKIKCKNIFLIKGSGVNLYEYPFFEEIENEVPVILVPARLIKEKGIYDIANASSLLKNKFRHEIWFAGSIDEGNPHSFTQHEIDLLKRNNSSLKFFGQCENMVELLNKCSLVCLPSYREGLPKALIEAAACGRAIITTDVPGCREIVSHKKTGWLVPPKSPIAISEAIEYMLTHIDFRKEIINKAYHQFIEEYTIENVLKKTISIYTTFE